MIKLNMNMSFDGESSQTMEVVDINSETNAILESLIDKDIEVTFSNKVMADDGNKQAETVLYKLKMFKNNDKIYLQVTNT